MLTVTALALTGVGLPAALRRRHGGPATPVGLPWLPDPSGRETTAAGNRAPFENMVADLQRLGRRLEHQSGISAERRLATLSAYDAVLADLAALLQIEQVLSLQQGPARDVERLRLGAALEHAGVSLEPGCGSRP